MNNYKVYSICNKDNPEEKYIGFTTQSMEQRLKGLKHEVELNLNTPKISWFKNIKPVITIIADELDVHTAMSLYKQLKKVYNINQIDLVSFLDLKRIWNETYIKSHEKIYVRSIIQMNNDGEEIQRFNSFQEAASAVGGRINSIKDYIKHPEMKLYGFRWKYGD